jgi:hypothetical protein
MNGWQRKGKSYWKVSPIIGNAIFVCVYCISDYHVISLLCMYSCVHTQFAAVLHCGGWTETVIAETTV